MTKMTFFTPMQMKLIITKGFALSLAWKARVCGTRKLPVNNAYFILIKNINNEKIN